MSLAYFVLLIPFSSGFGKLGAPELWRLQQHSSLSIVYGPSKDMPEVFYGPGR